MKRNNGVEAVQVILALAVIALTAVLFVKSSEMTVLFPVVFGLSSLMCFFYALEGIVFNRARMAKKSRSILFGAAGLILAVICWLSAKVVL